jgi:4-amino-4-deoxy-L-arabinose transferase-like glycosyltransferase
MRALRDWRNLAVVAACVLPLVGFWQTGLTDLDEGFYGAVVAEMIRTGDWITPHFNGAPWFEKPILAYWLAAPSVVLFGEDLGPRLPSALCTLLTGLVLFKFLRRHADLDTARIATAAYGGSLLVVGVGRMMLTDAPYVLALSIALTAFYDSVTGLPGRRMWAGAALGAAVLAKGPVAGILFVIIATFTYWRMSDLRPNFKGYWLTGAALFALVVASWYVPCYLENRDTFVQQFLIEQNIGRFRGTDLAHKTPVLAIPIYFPLVLFFALTPWSLWAVRAKWFQWPTDFLLRYLWIWGLSVLAFFSVSLTKLPHYILPAVAPFVVVTVVAVIRRREHQPHPDQWLKLALLWSATVCVLATTVFQLDYDRRFAEVHKVAKYLSDKPGYVFLFDVGRQERDTSIKLQINESANPSFLFYLRKEGKMTDDVLEVVKQEGAVWIVTEEGEMAGELSHNLSLAGFTLTLDEPPFETTRFEIWRAEPIKLP